MIVDHWVELGCLDLSAYGTHASGADLQAHEPLGAAQLLIGHAKLESAVRYLDIEIDDDLGISEQLES